jgi:hypothetical protein
MATTSIIPHNLYAVIDHLTPEVSTVFAEYLESPFSLGEVLENKPARLRQQVLDELALYFDIRRSGTQLDLYFKKEQ